MSLFACALFGCTTMPVVQPDTSSSSSAVFSSSSNAAAQTAVTTKDESPYAIIATVDPAAYRPSPESFQYIIQKFMIDSKEIETLGSINANLYHRPIRMEGGKVFFAQQNGELGSFDLQTKTASTVTMKDVTFSENAWSDSSLKDFRISESGIVYFLKGICSEGYPCSVHSFDMNTKKHAVILDYEKFGEKIPLGSFGGIVLASVDEAKQELIIHEAGGDAGWRYYTTYGVNTTNGEVKKAGTLTYLSCPNEIGGTEPCSPAQQKENEEFERLFPYDEKWECGKAEFIEDEDAGKLTSYHPDSKSFYYPDGTWVTVGESYFAGCVE